MSRTVALLTLLFLFTCSPGHADPLQRACPIVGPQGHGFRSQDIAAGHPVCMRFETPPFGAAVLTVLYQPDNEVPLQLADRRQSLGPRRSHVEALGVDFDRPGRRVAIIGPSRYDQPFDEKFFLVTFATMKRGDLHVQVFVHQLDLGRTLMQAAFTQAVAIGSGAAGRLHDELGDVGKVKVLSAMLAGSAALLSQNRRDDAALQKRVATELATMPRVSRDVQALLLEWSVRNFVFFKSAVDK